MEPKKLFRWYLRILEEVLGKSFFFFCGELAEGSNLSPNWFSFAYITVI